MTNKIMPGGEPLLFEGNSHGILFLHGFTSTPYEFRSLAENLSALGYSIRAPLLPGHGTQVVDLVDYRWQDWFAFVKSALFDLRKKCDKIVVIGLSMGASLALHLAAHFQVEGVVALAPGLFFKEKKAIFLQVVSPFIKYRKKKRGPDIKDKEQREKAVSYSKAPTRGIIELLKLFKHLEMDLPEIYCPTLIVHSVNDHVIDYKSSQYIYKHISSNEKKLLSLNESYHVLTLDVEKEIVKREIEIFLNKVFNPVVS